LHQGPFCAAKGARIEGIQLNPAAVLIDQGAGERLFAFVDGGELPPSCFEVIRPTTTAT